MNRTQRLAVLLVVAAALFAAGITYWYLKHPALKPSHEAYVTPATAARVVFMPARVQSYVSKLAPAATRFIERIPRLTSMQPGPIRLDWIHALPIEITLLFAQQLPTAQGVTLYVRESPESRDFAGVFNDSSFFRDLRLVQWSAPRLRAVSEHVFTAVGTLPIPGETQAGVERFWPQTVLPDPFSLEGGRLLEITASNENGALMEIHGAIRRTYGEWGGAAFHDTLEAAWPGVRRVSIAADLTQDDRIDIDFVLETTATADQASSEDALTALTDALTRWLIEENGFRFACDRRGESPGTISGHGVLTGFEAALRHELQ